MAFVYDAALDAALDNIRTNGDQLNVCSQEPTTYAEAVTTYSLGDAVCSIGAVGDRSPNGRKVTVAAINDANTDNTGTATHWAITDGTSQLIATGPLAASQALTSGNPWDLATFDIGIPDAA